MSLVVFDIGATLVTGPSRGPASRIAERLGLDTDAKRALSEALMTQPFEAPRDVASLLGGGSEAAVGAIWTAQEHEADPVPGAVEAFAAVAASGARIGLVSNIWAPYLRSVRRHYGALFDEHVAPELQLFSYREGSAKPARTLFDRMVSRAGVAPSEAVMVGDSYGEDIAPALAAGMRAVWVLHRPDREADHLVRVLDGVARRPPRTVRGIAEVTPRLLADVVGEAVVA